MLKKTFSFQRKTNIEKATKRMGNRIFKKCHIHIGTEKTGSSTIQRFLSINRARLCESEILYPKCSGIHGGSQWDFVARAHTDIQNTDIGKALKISSETDASKFRDTFDISMGNEFRDSKSPQNLVISSEHFHSRLTSLEMIDNLKKLLSPWVEEFKIILYLRRQDHLAVSLYSTKIKSGNPNPILFPPEPMHGLPYYFDYDRLYHYWSSVFGESSIIPRRFSSGDWTNGQLIDDFCSLCNIDPSGLSRPAPENESLNRVGAQFLTEVNKQVPSKFGEKCVFNREELTQLVSNLCKGKANHASQTQALSFYKQFKESNERLRERALPQLPSPLFDEDFSMYPEELSSTEPKYEEAVELAISIFRAMNKPHHQRP